MNKPIGWQYESGRHALAARGISTTMNSRGMIRAYKPLLTGRIKSLRTEEQDTLIMLYDEAFRYMEENNWSKSKALKALDEEYKRLKFIRKQTPDEDVAYQMEINENIQSIIGFTSPHVLSSWPDLREAKIEKYDL